MRGALVLSLAASRPLEVDGSRSRTPYVFDRRLLAVPIGSRFLKDVKGVANDVARPGVDERGDSMMPVPAIAQMAAILKHVRTAPPEIRQPIVSSVRTPTT
jgi:carboxylesterase